MKAGNVMVNKKTAESVVRNRLKECGYYDNEFCIIEEQESAVIGNAKIPQGGK